MFELVQLCRFTYPYSSGSPIEEFNSGSLKILFLMAIRIFNRYLYFVSMISVQNYYERAQQKKKSVNMSKS